MRRPLHLLFLALAALTAFAVSSSTFAAEPARLPRENLLVYRATSGAAVPVRNQGDWQRRRTDLVRGMEAVMGPFPGAAPAKSVDLDVRVEEEIDRDTYVIRRISYQSEPGSRTPAYLCVPKAALAAHARTFPAVLCLHPTDQTAGAGVVVGLGGKPNRQYASELAARGYVAIAPAYPHLAGYAPDLKGLGYASGTMKAIWDNTRALDVLESLPFVKRAGFGAIGHSLGGHNALYTAVFEPRLSVVVSSCGFDSFLDYYGGKPAVWTAGKGWCQERYMPRLLDYAGRLADIPFDFPEILGALAPRPVFVNAPLRDANFQWSSVDRVLSAARSVYTLYGASAQLTVAHPDSEHDFPDAQRETAYRLFDSVLK
jgi:dienelactone hydrolase